MQIYGRTTDATWDPEVDMWLVRVDGVSAVLHVGHWSAIDAAVARAIEAEEDER
jgi:hypothetical protein